MKRPAASSAEPEPTPAEQSRRLAIAVSVWPGFMGLPVDDAKRQLVQIDHVLAGRGCLLSQKERERIEEADRRLPEEGEP